MNCARSTTKTISRNSARTTLAREFLQSVVRRVMPEPMVEVTGSHKLAVTLMRKDNSLLLNLVNTGGDHHGSCCTFDAIPAVGPLTVRIRLPNKPVQVNLQPGNRDLDWHFDKVYYGCCEPVNNRWHILKQIPNLARVSVSPRADQEFLAEAFERDCVFSRKPNPSLISTERFDEELIRTDLRQTLEAAKGCRLEIIMKDVHTLNNEAGRLARWVQMAREEIEVHG